MDNVITLPGAVPEGPFARFNTPNSPILFPVGERPVGWQMRDGRYQQTRSHKAIIRVNPDGTGAIMLNIVGNGYQLVHNRELFTRVEQCMIDEMLPEHLEGVQVKDKVSGFGRICYREYVFPNIKCHLPNVRSNIGFRVIVQNGYGGSALRILSGAIDFYCENGMVSGEYVSMYRQHTSRLMIGDLDGNIKEALAMFTASQDAWLSWSVKRVKHEQVMTLFDAVATSKKMREGLVDQYARELEARGPVLWSVYSALTYYSSHNDGVFSLRSSVEEQNTTAQTMLARELSVAKWIKTKQWLALEHA